MNNFVVGRMIIRVRNKMTKNITTYVMDKLDDGKITFKQMIKNNLRNLEISNIKDLDLQKEISKVRVILSTRNLHYTNKHLIGRYASARTIDIDKCGNSNRILSVKNEKFDMEVIEYKYDSNKVFEYLFQVSTMKSQLQYASMQK